MKHVLGGILLIPATAAEEEDVNHSLAKNWDLLNLTVQPWQGKFSLDFFIIHDQMT